MTSEILEQLVKEAEKYGCSAVREAELREYTSFRIGGRTPCLIELDSADKCAELIPFAENLGIPYYVIGKGSNLIVDDRGTENVIFRISGGEVSLKDGNTAVCFAGTPLSRLCAFALENGLGGLEFAYGIPGSVGGAVYMNAGAYGGEIKDVILSADVLKKDGRIVTYTKDELDLSYRKSRITGSGEVILSAEFALVKADKEEIKAKMNELMEKRRSKQPLEYPSAGSTFKRPEGDYASRLIEQCGLKGLSVGGAQVSEKHSGFIVNKGGASFDDLMELIEKVKSAVKEQTGYALECEPEIISDREEYAK